MTRSDYLLLRLCIADGDLEALFRIMNLRTMSELVDQLDAAIKLAAKAMTGGNIDRADNQALGEMCQLIGHKP
jgi:hypothetical protein